MFFRGCLNQSKPVKKEGLLTKKELALEATGRPASLTNFVLIWDQAKTSRRNQAAVDVYEEVMAHHKEAIGVSVLPSTVGKERESYLHWATLNEMFQGGYYGYKKADNNIEIRYSRFK